MGQCVAYPRVVIGKSLESNWALKIEKVITGSYSRSLFYN
jgi:hypothetical protein